MAGYFTHNNQTYYFLHIPKTGGKMWETLFKDIGLTSGHDIVTSKPHGYSFTIIRNPLDRLVSSFCYLQAGGCHRGDEEDALKYHISDFNLTFTDWIYRVEDNPEFYFQQQHLMPMIRRIGKKEYFDHIALFEDLEQETKGFWKKFYGTELGDVPKINASDHDFFQQYYTPETKKIVQKLYKEDIVLYEEVKGEKTLEKR